MKPARAAERILGVAEEGLRKWEADGSTLDAILERLRHDAPSERPAVASLLFEYFRHKATVDKLVLACANKGTVKAPLRRIVALAASQAMFQTGIAPESAVNVAVSMAGARYGRGAGGFVNAILRVILRKAKAPFAPDFPESLAKRWITSYGADNAKGMMSSCASNPPLTLRARGVSSGDLERLSCKEIQGFDWTPPFKFYECHDAETLFKSGVLDGAKAYIQDPATALPVSLAAPFLSKDGGRVLDICSAPGGKSLMLKDAMPDIEIIAADRSLKRLAVAESNFRGAGADIPCIAASALVPPFRESSFSLALIDAPCSNSGVFRRRPDAAWRFSQRRLSELVGLQRRMLEAAAPIVRHGGAILYSTCSVEPEENSMLVESFVERNPSFRIAASRQILPCESHDGSFASVIIKE